MDSLDKIPSLESSSGHFNVENSTNYLHMKCQRNSLLFLTTYSYHQITNRRLRVLFPFTNSFYCNDSLNSPISAEDVQKIEEMIKSLIESNHQLEYATASKNDLLTYFEQRKQKDKLTHLNQSLSPDIVECIKINDFLDLTYGIHYETDISKLGDFRFLPFNNGFFLIFPHFLSDGSIQCQVPKELDKVSKYVNWAIKNGFDSIENINNYIKSGKDINDIDEKVQDYDLGNLNNISDTLMKEFPNRRVLAVSGSSSAGKSTFSKLIKKHIEENYGHEYECQILPMDDYFMNRDERPLDENGNIDYESMRVIHTGLLASRIDDLLEGKPIPERRYDYVDGIGNDIDSKITLQKKGFLIVEGLHALNPEFLSKIKETNVMKIYISPIAPLSIDCEHSFDPHDVLLFRRILRDFNQRGTSPRDNIEIWPSVEAGSARYLLPLLESADFYYTDQIVYELNAMQYAVSSLLKRYLDPVEKNPQVAKEVTAEVKRLSLILSLFEPLRTEDLPDRLLTKQLSFDTLNYLGE